MHSGIFGAKQASSPSSLNATWFPETLTTCLKARVRDMQEYRSLLGEKILALPGVADSRSYVVMEEVKETTFCLYYSRR